MLEGVDEVADLVVLGRLGDDLVAPAELDLLVLLDVGLERQPGPEVIVARRRLDGRVARDDLRDLEDVGAQIN